MKYLLASLLIGCLVSPSWSGESEMALKEFVQKLEKIEPWTQEKVETLLGVKLTMTSSDPRTGYTALGQFVYGEGLISDHISLEIFAPTNETLILRIELDDKSTCFTWEQIKKLFPNGHMDSYGLPPPGAETYYLKERTWGELGFGFRGECMTSIKIKTNAFIKPRQKLR
ncbi:MAG: hypothetical protein FWG26_10625 [Betaproteobacteria bacterium]|nr:hypothetical protein [Betaproteobacteria bacterium]